MNKRVSNKQLEQWDKLEKAATPGPWRILDTDESDRNLPGVALDDDKQGYAAIVEEVGQENPADAAFIAKSRIAVPTLIAEVRRSHAESDELRKRVEDLEQDLQAVDAASEQHCADAVNRERENERLRQRLDQVVVAGSDMRRLLHKATTRIEILRGRMAACNEEPQKHDLSISEAEGWIEEQQDGLAAWDRAVGKE